MDATSGHQLLSFMDAFSNYNQIYMATYDEEKTTFIIDKGLFYYRIMLFGLKNVGVIDQRLMNKIFKEQIRRNMKVYIGNMLVKSRATEHCINDLEDTFTTFQYF